MFAGVATLTEGLADTAADLQDLLKRFLGLWRQFLPMLSLFFCLSFINTMLDSLKDTLVITAAGGGAFVIPYLTVYAVLPLSMVFLVAFSFASQRMSRSALFNSIIMVFVAFFAVFALFLYPNADVLHPHQLADQLQNVRGVCCWVGWGCEGWGRGCRGMMGMHAGKGSRSKHSLVHTCSVFHQHQQESSHAVVVHVSTPCYCLLCRVAPHRLMLCCAVLCRAVLDAGAAPGLGRSSGHVAQLDLHAVLLHV
jgi:hypothetical protein